MTSSPLAPDRDKPAAASAKAVQPEPHVSTPGGEEHERPRLRYLGQLFDTYLLCQAGESLIAIDQHAVQERLIFEELRNHYNAGTMPGQILLFPAMVELVPAEVEALEQHGAELQRLGLELQEFGGDTVVIKAVPAGLGHLAPVEVLRGILSRFSDDQLSGQEGARLDGVLSGMACKAAIKAGHALTPVEVQHLLERIERSTVFSHCPHGRSVFKRFERREIERWFQRG
jgi:DNA mismatch repair protein MutL